MTHARTFLGIGFALLLPVLSAAQVRFILVDQPTVEQRLRQAPHDNPDRKNQLEQFFRDAGCDQDHLTNQKVSGSKLPNVICILGGSSESDIIVGAHFDNQGAGSGTVDNWSGASMLPSLYETLKKEGRRHSFRFIGFTDEEKGLIGSAFYARDLKKEEIRQIKAMVNLDTLGLGPPSLWLSHADKDLARMFYGVADAMKLPLNAVNVDAVGSSDSESFRERKIPSFTVHSLTQQTLTILHSPRDKISELKVDDYYQTYKLLAAYLVYLDQQLSID